MDNLESEEQMYQAYKPILFALAYRMLGSVMDAEDTVQEAFLALHKVPTESIDHRKAYLCKIVTNRCIDRLRVFSKQREVYIGPWLPEPLLTEGYVESDPSQAFMRKESISTAYLLLLQQLTWVERAVFILREVLEYDYDDIAEIVGKSSTNVRQIFHRAKRSIGKDVEPAVTNQIESVQPFVVHNLAEQFVQALAAGDVGRLMRVLSADATLYSDGGGKVVSAIRPILGAERIISFFMGIMKKASNYYTTQFASINGQTGIIGYENGEIVNICTFQTRLDQISDIYIVTNPAKLISFPLQLKLF